MSSHNRGRRSSLGSSAAGVLKRLGRRGSSEPSPEPALLHDRELAVDSEDDGGVMKAAPVPSPSPPPAQAVDPEPGPPRGHMRTRRRGSASEAMLHAAIAASTGTAGGANDDSDDDSDSDESGTWGTWAPKKAAQQQQVAVASSKPVDSSVGVPPSRVRRVDVRETALATAMRSVNAAQRPPNASADASCSNLAGPSLSHATNIRDSASSSGLNFTDELSTRRAILEVLAQHNASAGPNNLTAARLNMSANTNTNTNNKFQFHNNNSAVAASSAVTCDQLNELVKPKMQFGPMNSNENTVHPSFQSMMANGMMVPSPMMTMAKQSQLMHRPSSPPVSKKALLMKRACLEAEARPVPLKKKARKSVDSTFFSFAAAATALDSDSDSEGGSNDKAKLVPASNVPITSYADDDVLSGRGGGTNVHPGNRRFRDLIHANRRRYLRAKKNDKPAISRSIVRSIRRAGGRFLRKDDTTGVWYEIGDAGAREKTSQALRQRAPEMRKILFEDEAQRDGMARNAVVEHHAAAVSQQRQHEMNLSVMNKIDLQQQQQQAFQSPGDIDLPFPTPLAEQQQQQRRRSAQLQAPIPANASDLRRLAQEQNAGLSAALSSLGPSQDIQKPSPSPAMQQQQQRKNFQAQSQGPQKATSQLQQSQTGQAKDMLLQARMGMNPNAAYVQRNAQAWTTQTLLGGGINTFTPNIA